MQDFDKITISEISKSDMLMIIEALDYTGKHTEIEEFIDLKDNIIKELSLLTECTSDEFIKNLKNHVLKSK